MTPEQEVAEYLAQPTLVDGRKAARAAYACVLADAKDLRQQLAARTRSLYLSRIANHRLHIEINNAKADTKRRRAADDH